MKKHEIKKSQDKAQKEMLNTCRLYPYKNKYIFLTYRLFDIFTPTPPTRLPYIYLPPH